MERFWSKVDKSYGFGPWKNCWKWTAAFHKNSGYGQFKFKNKMQYAHRVAFELKNGQIPKEKLILHRCDNRLCVRPDHLKLGTHSDNTQDMLSKGRFSPSRGEKHGRSKLSENEVLEILAFIENGISHRKIANLYNIHHTNVSYIRRKKSWKHLKVPVG